MKLTTAIVLQSAALQFDIGWVRLRTPFRMIQNVLLEWYMLNASIWKSKLTMVFVDAPLSLD